MKSEQLAKVESVLVLHIGASWLTTKIAFELEIDVQLHEDWVVLMEVCIEFAETTSGRC